VKNPYDFTMNLSLQVGKLLKNRFNAGVIETSYKTDASIVTESDLFADELITQSILKEYPKDIILSEELHSNPSDLGEVTWVVDPLDGTTNFALGLQYWGVSIARLLEGQLQCAAIYFPLIDELYSAEYQHGAFLNGIQIHTKAPDPGQPAAFFSCCSRTFRLYHVSIPYKPRILGSAAYTLCAVARGIAVLGFDATPKIWDIAAGWLIACEAGGAVETFDKDLIFPLTESLDYSLRNYPTLVAADAAMLPRARSQIRPKISGQNIN
jgi:myo-inositol-1(or 4)-monophosphatase